MIVPKEMHNEYAFDTSFISGTLKHMTDDTPTQNSVKYDDNGIIEADYVDKQTYELVADNGDKIYNMAKKTRNEGNGFDKSHICKRS